MTDPTYNKIIDFAELSYYDGLLKDWVGENAASKSTATQEAAGLMSASDKSKLDGIAANATYNPVVVSGVTATSPIVTSAASGSITLSHASSGAVPSGSSSISKGDTSDQFPGFGGTFRVTSHTVDAAGHTTEMDEHGVTIPSAVAVASSSGVGGSNGLFSAGDKEKLDGVAAGATANVGTVTSVSAGVGLAGGPVTSSGSLKASLLSESKLSLDSAAATTTQNRVYPVAVDNSDKLAVNVPWTDTTYSNATPSDGGTGGTDGLMSATDKEKLNGIATGATASTGTVTSVATGDGLVGGTITATGTISPDLKSATKLSNDSVASTEVSGRVYAVRLDAHGKLAVVVPWEDTQDLTGVKGSAESEYRTGNVSISAANVGLGNVDNTSDANKPISTATQTALDGKVSTSLLSAANGVATLDNDGKVPESQLPSWMDDVIDGYLYNDHFYEDAEHTELSPSDRASGIIFVDVATNIVYRWSGSAYVSLSSGLALGTNHSTAYYGDYGAAAYAHGVTNKGSAFAAGFNKITTNAEGHVTGVTAVEKSDITALGIPAQDTTYSAATTDTAGLMSASDKTKLDGIAAGATANTGTVTSVSAGVGLAGGPVTSSGTIKANLKSETALSGSSAAATETSNRVYATVPDKDGYLATVVPWTDTTYSAATGGGLSLSGTEFSLPDTGPGTGTVGPTTAQTPAFGDSFKVPYLTTDAKGRVTARNEVNVTLPTASASQGLASGHSVGSITIGSTTTNLYSPPGNWYGTCSSTGADCVVTCSGFTLTVGAVVMVKFSAYNYAINRINVNNTGDIEIRLNGLHVNGSMLTTKNLLAVDSDTFLSFMYDGTYWQLISAPRSYYGTCSTDFSGTNLAHVLSPHAVIMAGTRLTVLFQNKFSYYSANALLGVVNDYSQSNFLRGAIQRAGLTVERENNNVWPAGTCIDFVYDGYLWHMTSGKQSWGQLAN